MSSKYLPTASYYNGHESDRLMFRPFESEDIERWLPFFLDKPSLRFVGMESGPFKTMADEKRSKAWIELQMTRQENGSFGQLAIIEKETGAFIGVGGLVNRMEEQLPDELEITYSLLPDARGKGYATELSLHFKAWAFEHTDIPSVVSVVHRENQGSIRVAAKNGMVSEKQMDYFEMPVYLFRAYR